MKSKRKVLVLLLATVSWAALPALAATLFSDDFNRADNDLLGGNWVERGDAGFDVDIVTNRAQLITPIASGHGLAYNTTALGTADYTVQAIVRLAEGATTHGVCGRRVNFGANDSDGYTVFLSRSADTLTLYKRVSGTWTQLGSYSVSVFAGDYTVKLSMQGTTIKAFLDGVERISVTDSALSAAGDACISAGNGGVANSQWDDFLVESFAAAGVARRRILK